MAECKHDKQLKQMLHAVGATLIRQKKHLIYELPNGQKVPMSQTPSDWRVGRKRITVLKHALAKESPVPEIEAPEIPARPMRRKRMAIPNWEAKGAPAPVELPKLDPVKPVLPKGTVWTPIGSLDELAYILGFMEEFWELTPGGRVRVLQKTLPPELRVEVLPIQFCRISSCESDIVFSGKKSTEDQGKCEKLFGEFLERMRYTCQDEFYPGLLVHDPEENQSLLVDVVSLSFLSDTFDDIQIIETDAQRRFVLAESPLWSCYIGEEEPPESVLILGMSTQFAKKHGIHFVTDKGWTDPSAIRHVLEALRERDNPGYVPKPRPSRSPELTPQEKVKRRFKDELELMLPADRWNNETNWLVTDCYLAQDNPSLNIEELDWIGRVFGFAFDNNVRYMSRQVEDPYMRCVQLWFSFLNEVDKKNFLEAVRKDDYCDPDDERGGFYKPESLECVPKLMHPHEVFNHDEYARIISSGHLAEKMEQALGMLPRFRN